MSIPPRFGPFETVRVLGEGSLGTVYLARDPDSGLPVAVKAIPFAGDPERRARFEEALKTLGSLSHPHLVELLRAGKSGDVYYVVMEYVAGGDTLARRLEREPPPGVDESLELGRQIAEALDFAHGQGVVHCDLYPANVLLTEAGEAKLSDFGLLELLALDPAQTRTRLTEPAYLSPEQVLGGELGPASDRFSLAALLYRLLAGRPPFAGEHPSAVLYQIAHGEPEPVSRLAPGLPSAVDGVLARGLAKDPSDRHESAAALVADLGRALAGGPGEAGREEAASEAETVPRRAPALAGDRQEGAAGIGFELHAAREPQVIAERARAARGSARRANRSIAALAAVVLAALAFFALRFGWIGGTSEIAGEASEEAAPAPEAAAEEAFELWVVTASDGAEIWKDGEATGLLTPARLPLEGEAGERVELEVRREGRVIAAKAFTLGPDLPAAWDAEAARLALTITSAPAGARVFVDGEDSGKLTPAELEFTAGRDYELLIRLAEHRDAGYAFSLESLSEAQRRRGGLHFPLRPVVRPGTLVATGAYAFTLQVAGRTHGPATRHRLELPPGSHQVRLLADSVFLRQTTRVEIAQGESRTLEAPAAVTVPIRALPGNCKVSIDGRFVDYTPIPEQTLAVGRHELLFEWPALGKSSRRTIDVDADTEPILARPNGGG